MLGAKLVLLGAFQKIVLAGINTKVVLMSLDNINEHTVLYYNPNDRQAYRTLDR